MFGRKKEIPQSASKTINLKDLPKPNSSKLSKRLKFVILFIILIFIFFATLIIFAIIFPSKNTAPEVEETVGPVSELNEEIFEGLPEENTLYFGKYNGEEVIFIKNILGFSYVSDDPYFGYTNYSTGSAKVKSFNDITDPIKLIDFGEPIQGDLFGLNKNKSKLYINISKKGDRVTEYPNIDNFLYVVDLSTQENRIIWENAVGSGKYEEGNGTAYVKEVINDNYVILDILNCYGCEPSSAGNIIINIESGDDKYVKGASIMSANLANNTFSYQNLEIVKEPCQDGDLINCDRNNMMDVRKPSGEIFSEKLP